MEQASPDVSGVDNIEKDESEVDDELAKINELARKGAAGDREAVKHLFGLQSFLTRLRAICEYFARRYGTDPDELMQEAYEKVNNKINTFRSKSSFLTWLNPVIKNLQIDLLRKQGRIERNYRIQGDLAEAEQSRKSHPETVIAGKIDLQRVIDKLPDPDKHIVKLWASHKSIEEIAQAVGLTPDQTEQKLEKAQQKLLKVL
jgi:RNA polymerase sigma factor (sigma-70 family)